MICTPRFSPLAEFVALPHFALVMAAVRSISEMAFIAGGGYTGHRASAKMVMFQCSAK